MSILQKGENVKMENKAFFKEMNEVLAEWQGKAKPSEIKQVESDLKRFYKSIGKNPKDNDIFNTRLKLTPEQEEEMLDIALGLYNNAEELEYYEDIYRDYKKRFGFKGIEDAVEFIERMKAFKSDALLKEIISSEQYIELVKAGQSKGMSVEDINEILYIEYSGSGATFDNLYNQVLGAIDEYDEKQGGWNL